MHWVSSASTFPCGFDYAFGLKKSLQELAALRFKNATGGEFDVVVDARKIVEVGGATQTTHFWIRYRIAHALHA